MKKSIFALTVVAFVFSLTMTVSAQQGKWKGTVKYKLSYEGAVSPQAPTEWMVKVYENKTRFLEQFVIGADVLTNANNKTAYLMFDFSQIPVDGVQGKYYIKNKVTDEDFAKHTYNFTGNVKTLAGKNVKEVNVVSTNDEGEEEKETIWVCDEIGPAVDVMFYPGLKAMPFAFDMEFKEHGIAIHFEAIEVTEGKIKDTDCMLESGYEEVTEEEFKEIVNILQEAYGAAGGGDDDI